MTPRLHVAIVTVLLTTTAANIPPARHAHADPAVADLPVASAQPAIGLDEHVGAAVPRDLVFTDTTGARVTLGDVLVHAGPGAPGDGRPTLLVMAYARCTMLCGTILHDVATAVRAAKLAPGRDVHLVVVSLDPRETPDEGARRQATLLEELGAAATGDRAAWPYLVGDDTQIHALADALGFRYAWDPRTEQYAHPAVLFVLTPDARIAEYLRGVSWPDPILPDAIARAGRGQLTTDEAQDVVRCFHFDPALRAHEARIQRYFQIGACLVFAGLASLVALLLLHERRRRPCSR